METSLLCHVLSALMFTHSLLSIPYFVIYIEVINVFHLLGKKTHMLPLSKELVKYEVRNLLLNILHFNTLVLASHMFINWLMH